MAVASRQRNRRSRTAPSSMQVNEFTDEEFLAVVRDNGDSDGWVSTEELADAIGITGKLRNNMVGCRLGFMRSRGLIERNDEAGSPVRYCWRLSLAGEFLINSKLKPSEMKLLADADEGQLWQIQRVLADLSPTLSVAGWTVMRRAQNVGDYRRRQR